MYNGVYLYHKEQESNTKKEKVENKEDKNMVDWSYFDKFEKVNEEYLPDRGEGETKATQIVTAICKLVYKWYNDGDVFDNTNYLDGGCNDLSSYANWLAKYAPNAEAILNTIYDCWEDGGYEDLLKELADSLLEENYLAWQNEFEKIGSIYECDGKFKFIESYDDEEDDW